MRRSVEFRGKSFTLGCLTAQIETDRLRASSTVPNIAQLSLEMSGVRGTFYCKTRINILPLNLDHVQNIAVIGPNAGIARTAGGGNSFVQTNMAASILDGLRDRVGGKANVQYSLGVQMPVPVAAIETPQLTPVLGVGNGLYAEYFNNANLQGTPTLTWVDPAVSFFWDAETSPDPSIGFTNFSVRWTGQLTMEACAMVIEIANQFQRWRPTLAQWEVTDRRLDRARS